MSESLVLSEANHLVHGNRQADYGHPAVVYARVGRIWGALLGIEDIDAATVALMLGAMKLGRESIIPKRDNLVDLAGYAEVVAMCRQKEAEACAVRCGP